MHLEILLIKEKQIVCVSIIFVQNEKKNKNLYFISKTG